MHVEDIRRVVIVGAGTMGQQIAFQCAGHGLDVVLYDVAPKALAGATAAVAGYADGLVQGGIIGGEVRDAALARITTASDQAQADRTHQIAVAGTIGQFLARETVHQGTSEIIVISL